MSEKVYLDCVRSGQYGSGRFSEKFKQERKITVEQDEKSCDQFALNPSLLQLNLF